MPLSEDFTEFFDTDEFATDAVYLGTTIQGIFLDEYFDETGIESTSPMFVCAASSVPAVRNGAVLTINGTNYEIISPQPDGTGVQRLKLNKR